MAKIKGNVKMLLSYDDEISKMERSVHFQWNEPKITTFYAYNGANVEKYKKKLESLQNEFMVMEGGKPKVENRMPVLKEGKTREELDTIIKSILEEEVYITF